jgi:ketosteroid isomerase-like protein
MQPEHNLLIRAYAAFNARDIEAALAMMQPNVTWPNGMEGGYVSGRDGVREYWTRQWNMIDPHVEPLEFSTDEEGDIVVVVHQVVRNLAGAVLTDQRVLHTYEIADGLIAHMDISEVNAG